MNKLDPIPKIKNDIRTISIDCCAIIDELTIQSEQREKDIQRAAFTKLEKAQFYNKPTEKIYNEDGILTHVIDMQGKSVRGNGSGIVFLGYYNSESNRWAYAPNHFGRILDLDGIALQDGKKTWTRNHTPAKSTGLIESVDVCGRKYLLISANDGYVPTRTDGDPLLAGWTTLDSNISVIFDNNYTPHPACDHIDYAQHGFSSFSTRIWWPLSLGEYHEADASGALQFTAKKLKILAPTILKSMPSYTLDVNKTKLELSADIHEVITLLNSVCRRMNAPSFNLEKNIAAKMYLKFATSVLEIYKEYDAVSIEKKLRYVSSVGAERLRDILNHTRELNDSLITEQSIDLQEATRMLEQFFVTNFEIMTKNGTETGALVNRSYEFWLDNLNDIADHLAKDAETLVFQERLTALFTTLDQHNQMNGKEAAIRHGILMGTLLVPSEAAIYGGIGALFGPISGIVSASVAGIITTVIVVMGTVGECERRLTPSRRQIVNAEVKNK